MAGTTMHARRTSNSVASQQTPGRVLPRIAPHGDSQSIAESRPRQAGSSMQFEREACEKRAAAISPTGSPFVCILFNKDCHSRIGLLSHIRRCSQKLQTERISIVSRDSALPTQLNSLEEMPHIFVPGCICMPPPSKKWGYIVLHM